MAGNGDVFRWMLERVSINAEEIDSDDRSLLQLALHSENSLWFFETLARMARDQSVRHGNPPGMLGGLVNRNDRGLQVYRALRGQLPDEWSEDEDTQPRQEPELHNTDFDALVGARDSGGQSLLHHLASTGKYDEMVVLYSNVDLRAYFERVSDYDERKCEKRNIKHCLFEWKDDRGRTAIDIAAARVSGEPSVTPGMRPVAKLALKLLNDWATGNRLMFLLAFGVSEEDTARAQVGAPFCPRATDDDNLLTTERFSGTTLQPSNPREP